MPEGVSELVEARAAQLFREDLGRIHRRTDRLFAALMVLQWAGGLVTALTLSPSVWEGGRASWHPNVWAALVLGTLISAAPLLLALLRPGEPVTRGVVAAAQVAWSSLLIHLSGGRIETHFHVFGSLAFLALYRDMRVLLIATAVVSADHVLRGVWWPQSVFGTIVGAHWRWAEHAAWVLFEVVVLAVSGRQSAADLRRGAWLRARVEEASARTEEEIRRRTRQLLEATEAAEAASRSKSNFLANMSHEIRTPMTAILGYADLLRDPAVRDGDRREYVESINRNGVHLLALLNDILDLSKIEAGRMTVERIPTRVDEILYDVLSLMRERAAAKRLTLSLVGEGPVPRVVRTDPTRFRQILLNLVGNALKFTEAGGVRLHLGMEGARLRVRIADTGVGITPEQMDRLFAAFQQADESVTRRYGGTGLGLSISRNLARLLGGDITAESGAGSGSVFSITIDPGPVDAADLADVAAELAAVGDRRGRAGPGTPGAAAEAPVRVLEGTHVLLVEDGVDNQKLISFHLRKAGAEVTIAGHGAEGLRLLTADGTLEGALKDPGPFDLILTDMQMPEMDGYTLATTLRARGCRVPVIALTAHAMSEDSERCKEAGCDGYATKPIDRIALVRLCAEWVGRPLDGGRRRPPVLRRRPPTAGTDTAEPPPT